MKNFNHDELQAVLDLATEKYENLGELISVEFNSDNQILVRFKENSIKLKELESNQKFTLKLNNEDFEFNVSLSTGPEINEAFGDIKLHPPIQAIDTQNVNTMGGDQVRNSRDMNKYGTISFYAGSIQWESRGTCSINCTVKPALVSNNHVIALSDVGQVGDTIWTPYRADVAILDCIVPLRCTTNSDIAFARVTNRTGIKTCQIRQIGSFPFEFRRPVIGERIHKYGARTGYTTGTITGIANIRVGNRQLRGVYVTSNGFSCPGDSGSTVVAMNDTNHPLGLLSWGESIPCEQNPKGYFFAFPPSNIIDNQNNNEFTSLKGESDMNN
jgi:hypothetical protein